ncbi:MAG: c-type cytochrome [Candidatus Marinimicrobia bacterium]|nr:c-type cytochrome [Candidatus Neomarinimicrobiota bacterium]MCF7921082.1 c-type cytochrome [Candidatus Neomarinimicrobiota bacterium]
MYRSLFLASSLLMIAAIFSCSSKSELNLHDIHADLVNGEKIYKDNCMLCHTGAIEGAHRLDQNSRWQESAEKGFDQLVYNTVHGYRGKYGELPVMGMCSQCSEKDIEDAVAYMLTHAGVMK